MKTGATGEPNEGSNGEDCVYIKGASSSTVCQLGSGSGCWNDYPCDPSTLPNHHGKSFICGPKSHGARLACASSVGTGTCHQGRIELLNPYSGHWGTVCGHHVWNNDFAANVVCQELGFQSGTIYTYGSTMALPAGLPIVAGYRECVGTVSTQSYHNLVSRHVSDTSVVSSSGAQHFLLSYWRLAGRPDRCERCGSILHPFD